MELELNELWQRKRPEVVLALSAAAAEGDRSENAEYTYRKKQLAEIDRRVRYLVKRLKTLKVVEELPFNQKQVFFGAFVELEDDDGALSQHRIVGPDETDATLGYISIDSPLARALIKKTAGDEVSVVTPGGTRVLLVRSVQYQTEGVAI